MRIIKHGNFLKFYCVDCGCEWYASKNESIYVSHDATMMPPEWGFHCPDCGKWNTSRTEAKGDEVK